MIAPNVREVPVIRSSLSAKWSHIFAAHPSAEMIVKAYPCIGSLGSSEDLHFSNSSERDYS